MSKYPPPRSAGGYSLEPSKPRRSFLFRVSRFLFLFALLAVLGLAIAHGVWTARASSELDARLAAYRQKGEPVDIQDVRPAPIPDDQNAAAVLNRAAAMLKLESAEWKAFDGQYSDIVSPMSAEQLTNVLPLLEDYAEPIRLARQARALPGVDWQLNCRSPLILVLLPHLSQQRELSRLLAIAAVAAHDRGDDDQALQFVEDIRFISAALDRQAPPTLVSHLVSIGIRCIADQAMAVIATDLAIGLPMPRTGELTKLQAGPQAPRPASRTAVVAAIHAMLDESAFHEARKRAIQGERVMVLDTLRGMADGSLPLDQLTSPNPQPNRTTGMMAYVIRPMALSDAGTLADAMTAHLNVQSAPDFVKFGKLLSVPTPPEGYELVLHYFAAVLGTKQEKLAQQDYLGLSDRRMAAVVLATRLYRVDNSGRMPGKLQDLVPYYLPSIPMDAMADGQPLQFRPEAEWPKVYSVGLDLTDDGGIDSELLDASAPRGARTDRVKYLVKRPKTPSYSAAAPPSAQGPAAEPE